MCACIRSWLCACPAAKAVAAVAAIARIETFMIAFFYRSKIDPFSKLWIDSSGKAI